MKRFCHVGVGLVVVLATLGAAPAPRDPAQAGTTAYLDLSLPTARRVDDLIGQMTLTEKVSQLQDVAAPIERLGVPGYNWWSEGLHGVGRAGIATVFPQAIGLAATWDTVLMERVATAIADEARAKHHDAVRRGIPPRYFGLTYWSPNVNIFRDPRWGRGQETYGEDPHLTSRLGVAFVRGLQGNDPRYLKIVATPKHLAVHSGPEPERHSFDAVTDERDLRETYLPAFEATLVEGGALSTMCAYNRYRGEACCASDRLLGKILRGEWGFGGYVVSDCGAIDDIEVGHRLAPSREAASALAVRAGCDLECGNRYATLEKAVAAGLLSEREIDTALRRLFTARFRLGMFDPPERVPFAQIPMSVVDSAPHRALALEAARESLVLLKNDGVLPLRKDVRRIAVVGPLADHGAALLGNYNGVPSRFVTPLMGIRAKVTPQTKVLVARGAEVSGVELRTVPSAALAAHRSDRTGLFGEYFDNPTLSGAPVLTRVDRQIDFDWRATAPALKLEGKEFSVRWTGWLVAPASGKHWLGAVGGGADVRVFVEERLVIDTSGSSPAVRSVVIGGPNPLTTTELPLEQGRAYALRIEMVKKGERPRPRLLWLPPTPDDLLEEALARAQDADVIVACVGMTPAQEGEEQDVFTLAGFRGGDRTDIALPAAQERLLESVGRLGKPVVVVLVGGSAIASPWASEHAAAVLAAWYPGQDGGAALADVLFGDAIPSGRLPVTFYKSVEQLPPFDDYRMQGRTYRYFGGETLYPFGHGLSYTRFAYDRLRITPAVARPGKTIEIAAEVANVGSLAGDEVVQLYVTRVGAAVPVPIRSLEGFTRVSLRPGERRRVVFRLTPRQMSLIDADGRRLVEAGELKIAVGGKQPGQTGGADAATTGVVEGTFRLSGARIEIPFAVAKR